MAAVVYIVILAMWAAVLVPMWARHRDESRSLRTVDHFRRALVTLSDDPQMQQLLPVSSAMGRRRRVYSVLLGLFVVCAVLWIAQVVDAGLLLLPVGLAVAFTAAARRQVRAENRQRDAAIRYLRARSRGMAAHPAGQNSRPQGKTVSSRPESVSVRPAVRVDGGIETNSAASAGWSAQPLTLPTYVTAPAATAVPRKLDAASAGGWDRAQMLREARDVRQQQDNAQERDFIDDFLERTHVEQTHAARSNRDEVFDQLAVDERRVANG